MCSEHIVTLLVYIPYMYECHVLHIIVHDITTSRGGVNAGTTRVGRDGHYEGGTRLVMSQTTSVIRAV